LLRLRECLHRPALCALSPWLHLRLLLVGFFTLLLCACAAMAALDAAGDKDGGDGKPTA
jgi:hypothetical protein